ncbi:hypothetical protein MSAN_02440000 [Mycena sanguinolenta]|uniref:Ubiquitin-like protease family profile domain-containing protein n=1 Tax=Mycena sanguinolenta TaxID=230812 RepID=A0A8H7CCM0_9AGAR|nr:hypothetical protein MSAN_02440000 [Mycena sanguinolenta]
MAPNKVKDKRSARRNDRAVRSGMGAQSNTPRKLRDPRNQRAFVGIGRGVKMQHFAGLWAELDGKSTSNAEEGASQPIVNEDVEMNDDWVDEPLAESMLPRAPSPSPPPPLRASSPVQVFPTPSHRTAPPVHKVWEALLPRLEAPFLQYRRNTHGRIQPIIPDIIRPPARPYLSTSSTSIAAFSSVPVTPSQQLQLRSVKPTPAEGFRIFSRQEPGARAADPFRKALTCLAEAAATLRPSLPLQPSGEGESPDEPTAPPATSPVPNVGAHRTPRPIASPPAATTPSSAPTMPSTQPSVPPASQPSALHGGGGGASSVVQEQGTGAPPPPPPLTPGRAHQILRDRCPACFGLETWGRPLKEGGDVQLGADGCFSYRHLKSAGDGPISYTPDYFIPKEKIDNVRARIASVRRSPPAACKPKIPQEVLDACETSWEAANEKKRKADPQRYDASGVFVATCRHSQVLFMCNIDTPGEQQAYVIAAIETVAEHLPPQATILQTYDVGCVSDHSLNLFPILAPGLRERLSFCINVMHAFGHQWVCQLVYNPRMRRGCGLTDGEGVERIWSRIRKLIPLTRNQWNSRRIWMIDTYISFVNEEGLENLGTWLQRQEEKNLAPKLAAAQRMLRECRVSEQELRQEWAAQKAAQSSLRAHAPVRLKRELDKVLALQVQIDTVETSISEVRTSITDGDATAETTNILSRLQTTHQRLSEQAEALYASLNIANTFPELQGLPLEFVRTLLIMRDLKINIRKRAVGSFYEWETLDRAVSGRREALGTKLHQATRKAITKRQPALIKAISKFNAYCERLETLRPPGCQIPIPAPLSTRLNGLRDDPTLHEDVWIERTSDRIPRWLGRLRQELAVVDKALETNEPDLRLLLEERRDDLQYIRHVWAAALRRRALPSNPIPITAIPASRATARASATASATARTRLPVDDDDTDEAFDAPDESNPTDMVSSEELDPGLISDVEAPLGVEDLLDRQHEIEETTVIETLPYKLCWEPPILVSDSSFLQDLYALSQVAPAIDDRSRRIFFDSNNRRYRIDIEAIDRLIGTERLNNFVLNGVAAALHAYFTRPDSFCRREAADCAVLSTFELVRTRYNCSDAQLWRGVYRTQYWNKSTWLVPIHRPTQEHWVLAVVAVPQQQIFFFDSFASKSGWRGDLKALMTLITRMVALAERNGHSMNIDLGRRFRGGMGCQSAVHSWAAAPDEWLRLRCLGAIHDGCLHAWLLCC